MVAPEHHTGGRALQDLRDFECLIALARHRHFARAAAQCGLSQPAFSMRIRGLEDRLKTRIVKRGNRFQGFTPEGDTVLAHAKTIIAQVRALEEEVRAQTGEITGSLTLGVIPTAGAYAARVVRQLHAEFPGIQARLETATSLAIQSGVDDGQFDAGFTYTEGASTDLLQVRPLYDERYVLLVPDALLATRQATITWTEAAALPLILLETSMQNRRILDQVFREVGPPPHVIAETNGFMAAVLMASEGLGATVIPEVLRSGLGPFDHMQAIPLTGPDVEKSVSFVSRRDDKRVPTVDALITVLGQKMR